MKENSYHAQNVVNESSVRPGFYRYFVLAENGNINKSHLDIMKLHLKRKGNSVLGKNLLEYFKNC